VAKTTTCLNLGHALSERGRRVLLVDLDPQACLTISLGVDVRELTSTIYDVLLATDPNLSIKDIVQATTIKNVSLAPASIDLSKAEMDLFSEMNRERALKDVNRRPSLTHSMSRNRPLVLNLSIAGPGITLGRRKGSSSAPIHNQVANGLLTDFPPMPKTGWDSLVQSPEKTVKVWAFSGSTGPGGSSGHGLQNRVVSRKRDGRFDSFPSPPLVQGE